MKGLALLSAVLMLSGCSKAARPAKSSEEAIASSSERNSTTARPLPSLTDPKRDGNHSPLSEQGNGPRPGSANTAAADQMQGAQQDGRLAAKLIEKIGQMMTRFMEMQSVRVSVVTTIRILDRLEAREKTGDDVASEKVETNRAYVAAQEAYHQYYGRYVDRANLTDDDLNVIVRYDYSQLQTETTAALSTLLPASQVRLGSSIIWLLMNLEAARTIAWGKRPSGIDDPDVYTALQRLTIGSDLITLLYSYTNASLATTRSYLKKRHIKELSDAILAEVPAQAAIAEGICAGETADLAKKYHACFATVIIQELKEAFVSFQADLNRTFGDTP
jgi:hypothetical protein